jgi:hypothetical protein
MYDGLLSCILKMGLIDTGGGMQPSKMLFNVFFSA